MNIAKWPIFQCWAHCCDDVCWCLCIGQSPVPRITIPPPGVMKAAAVTTLTCHFHIIFCLLQCSCAGHPGAKMASNDWLEDISSVTCLFSVPSCCSLLLTLEVYIQFVLAQVWDTLLNIEVDSDCFIEPDNGSHFSCFNFAPVVFTDSNSDWILKTVV